ncbi:MAG: DUF4097 family beta strand repeat-containing protein [Gemmatimonadaceae bacterium]
MNRILVASALALTFAGTTNAQGVVGRKETTYDISERIANDGRLRLSSPNGDINITAGSGDKIEIHAEKVLRRGSPEDVGFVVRRESNELIVCAVYDDEDECDSEGYHGRRNGWRRWRDGGQPKVNFTVRMPAGIRVNAGSGNGDVSITGGGNEVTASTGNGRVNVSGTSGEVTASTGNGRVTVEGAKGPVQASTGNGDVRVTTSLGPVTASSGNGDIEVSMDRLEASRSMEFSTGNGRIIVTVPEDFGAELDGNTGSGSISSDFPIQIRGRLNPTRIRGTIGKGGGRLVMSSGNGNLEIRKRA